MPTEAKLLQDQVNVSYGRAGSTLLRLDRGAIKQQHINVGRRFKRGDSVRAVMIECRLTIPSYNHVCFVAKSCFDPRIRPDTRPPESLAA